MNTASKTRYFKVTNPDEPKGLPGTLTLHGNDEEVARRANATRKTGLIIEEISFEEERRIRRSHELIRRVKNLQTFAHSFKGSDHYMIQSQCYMVLRTHCSEWEALYRHFRYVVKGQIRNAVIFVKVNCRIAWLRYVCRMSVEEINELFDNEDAEFLASLQKRITDEEVLCQKTETK